MRSAIRSRSSPRFAFLHFLDIHGPYTPDAAHRPPNLPPTQLVTRTIAGWRKTIDLVRKGFFPAGSKVLYAHLGGVPAINGYSYTFRNG